jgi:hypothetical protein
MLFQHFRSISLPLSMVNIHYKHMAIIEYNEEMFYGLGYNSLTGQIRGRAVEYNPNEIEGIELDLLEENNKVGQKHNANGQKASLIIQSISSNEQLSELLNLSGSIEGGFMGIVAGGKLSAKGEFNRENKISRYSTYLMVRYVVRNAARRINPRLNSDAIAVLKQGVDQFRKKYGDEFIVGFISGGEYICIIEIEGSSQQKREEISGKLSASFQKLAISLNGGGQLDKSDLESIEQSNCKIKYYKAGGENFGVAADISKIVSDINDFAKEVRGEKATNYLAITTDYDTLNMPEICTIVDSDLEEQKKVLNKLAQKRIRYVSHMSDIEFIVQNQKKFDLAEPIQIFHNKYAELSEELKEIEKLARICIKEPVEIATAEFEEKLYKDIQLSILPSELKHIEGR